MFTLTKKQLARAKHVVIASSFIKNSSSPIYSCRHVSQLIMHEMKLCCLLQQCNHYSRLVTRGDDKRNSMV